ncbi:MAG: hypothetical protein PHP03_01310 [Candidatus Pacebacteria bacterium]|nr:hypothetical protein [Candidatus Paceibacterota bacterium]
MIQAFKEFVLQCKHYVYKFKIGQYIATSLTGFIGGVLFASIIWGVCVYLLKIIFKYTCN